MRPGRCIAIRGGSRESRLACAAGIARCCSESGGTTVSFAGPWNSTGDPDPYNGYPFSSLVLVAPEASLVYRRPGVDPAAFSSFSDISADLVLVGLPGTTCPASPWMRPRHRRADAWRPGGSMRSLFQGSTACRRL